MIRLITIFLFFICSAYAAVDGPPAATPQVLSDQLNRTTHFGLIINYLEKQAIFDIVEHYTYLQNRDKSNLNLTKKQRKDLMKYIDTYYRILKAKHVKTPVNVTCQAPAQQ